MAAARLGAVTSFVGAIGNDDIGAAARAALEADGIDLRGLVTIRGAATGVALVLVDAAGENSIAVAGGATRALDPDHVRAALERLRPGAGDVLLVGHEIRTETAREALRIRQAAGATTILNPAPADGLDPATLKQVDILTPNRGELAVLAGSNASPAQAARQLVDGLPLRAVVVVSLGSDGALVIEREAGRLTRLPALAVSRSVDAVGAGDTLNGALAAGLAAGLPLADAARRAVTAASLSRRAARCPGKGCRAWRILPDRAPSGRSTASVADRQSVNALNAAVADGPCQMLAMRTVWRLAAGASCQKLAELVTGRMRHSAPRSISCWSGTPRASELAQGSRQRHLIGSPG